MAKIAQLVEGNYNILDNIPIINQDLSASGFTPVANTYYRHTGATTASFTQGVIYLYDTAYHKLGESGGTTLNKYELSINTTALPNNTLLLYKIYTQAKGRVIIGRNSYNSNTSFYITQFTPYYIASNYVQLFTIIGYSDFVQINGYSCINGTLKRVYAYINSDNTISDAAVEDWNETIKVIYYNDTEITA